MAGQHQQFRGLRAMRQRAFANPGSDRMAIALAHERSCAQRRACFETRSFGQLRHDLGRAAQSALATQHIRQQRGHVLTRRCARDKVVQQYLGLRHLVALVQGPRRS